MDRIGAIIGKRLNQHKLGESARASEIVHRANKLLQEKLQCGDDEVRAFRLKDGILYVGTVGSAWSQEVFHHQEGLINEIRKAHGTKSVLKIVIKSLTSS
ncbi:MAG: DciA family protein [Patescibacteria group bacterium]